MKILIIDDEPSFRLYLVSLLKDVFRHDVIEVGSFNEADSLEKSLMASIDLAFIDMNMPIIDGFHAGLTLKHRYPSLVTVMLTAFPTVEKVIKALRDHQFDDFLIKEDLEDVSEFAQLKNALLRAENLSAARKALSDEYKLSDLLRTQYTSSHGDFIGNSEAISRIKSMVEKVARGITTILITGETGSGKEVVAREIHKKSDRNTKPFIPINCSAIPFGLLESELFGHKKGSFTGAVGDRAGYFKLAEGGTLFLDEIGDMPVEIQSKLLRVLEEKQFFPIGSSKLEDAVKLNVRIISATHQNLNQKIDSGQFRRDLLYRLNTVVLEIPPLRERRSDIERLAIHFIRQKSVIGVTEGISKSAVTMLQNWNWPGNVRELQNVIERAVLLSKGKIIDQSDLPKEIQQNVQLPDLTLNGEESLHNELKSNETELIDHPYSNNENKTASQQFWESFKNNQFKLWYFEEAEILRESYWKLLIGAKYIKKGHSGRICVNKPSELITKIRYINAIDGLPSIKEIRFVFFDQTESLKSNSIYKKTGILSGTEILQPVLKGLPDTYIFNHLYPPAKKSELNAETAQRLARAAILRFATEQAGFSSLKSIFEQTLTFITDQALAERIDGLNTWGLEAIRAYLCGADHIFAGMATRLKSQREWITSEVQSVFT